MSPGNDILISMDLKAQFLAIMASAANDRGRMIRPEQQTQGAVPRHIQYKKDRKRELKSKYDITPEQYDVMVIEQGGQCAICQEIPDHILFVDHDHSTNYIRGLLCSRCNLLLGQARDDPHILREAARYLNGG